ncbi:chaplin [Kitasatospora sp. GP82]|uniref:chaplin n=1 Tax=Kitasatospora sp. GP82 TaxID=3035089 RepID=UPI0024737E3C|nr:chaplin [Kitasatospora sp. GP82]MDH6129634.1 LPXTG-motif cell wall-anchored protein [Kitasatospora sp. GP82]
MRQVAKRGILTAVATGSVLASTAGYAYASAEAHGGAANSPGVGSGNSVQAPVDIPVNACGNTVNVVGLLNPAMGSNCGNVDHGTDGTQGAQGTDGGPNGPGHAGPGASAEGGAHNSPGVLAGNNAQAPITIPVNACGNSVNVVGAGNPAFGNDCGNHGSTEVTPPSHSTPAPGDDCPPVDTGAHNPPPRSTPPVGTPPTGTDTGTGGSTQTPPSGTGTNTGVGGGTTGSGTGSGTGAARVALQTQAQAQPAQTGQLASTGADGLELIAPAGVALLLGGGVLYRRSRAAAR